MPDASSFYPSWSPQPPRDVNCDDTGIVAGWGTPLVRMEKGRLAVEADGARCVALLSVLCQKSLGAEVLRPIEAAAAYWAAGDKALANLRLVLSDLPKLGSAADAYRLEAAAYCLDRSLTPRELMKALGLDPSVIDLEKFDPDQPRVPAGSGRESGRWMTYAGTGAAENRLGATAEVRPSNAVISDIPSRQTPIIVQVAANGPLKPGGINVVPIPGVDSLDPKGLNTPLSLAEQQAIADTVNMIQAGKPEDVLRLNPHEYKNLPSKRTGAILPPSIGGYTTYYVRPPGAPAGTARIVSDRGRQIFYSNNHYDSFYPVDIKTKPEK